MERRNFIHGLVSSGLVLSSGASLNSLIYTSRYKAHTIELSEQARKEIENLNKYAFEYVIPFMALMSLALYAGEYIYPIIAIILFVLAGAIIA